MTKDIFHKREPITRDKLIKRIDAASGRVKADIVIKNGRVIDVFNGEMIQGDVAITDGFFVGIGNYEGEETIDAEGKFICPGFIDGHVHIESSMLTPEGFARVVIPHGVTAVVADPHEIANVAGSRGIDYMLKASENLPLDVYFMLPSCVPATSFENSGARLEAEDVKPFLTHPRVLGLGEVMNYPAVLGAEDGMLEKLLLALNAGVKIDGHGAGLDSRGINIYMSTLIGTDHECVNEEELKERIRRGMYVMIREGTAAKNLKDLIGAVTLQNSRRCVFVTDDKHLDDLFREGSIDHNIRLAILNGLPPITAIQMATLNTCECFGLEGRGAVAPGFAADFLLLEDLESVKIHSVYKAGKLISEKGTVREEAFIKSFNEETKQMEGSVHIESIAKEDFAIPLMGKRANIIEIVPNSLITKKLVENVKVVKGEFISSIEEDKLKIAVVKRHRGSGKIGLGIVKGFGLKEGALASTVVHDSHNLIVVGTNDDDMVAAVEEICRIQGGLVAVKNGLVIASLRLPVGGLMCDLDYKEAVRMLDDLNRAALSLGVEGEFNAFLTLSFLGLPVIPDLKLTDMGLFDVRKFRFIDIEA